jgi:hypothetical protein
LCLNCSYTSSSLWNVQLQIKIDFQTLFTYIIFHSAFLSFWEHFPHNKTLTHLANRKTQCYRPHFKQPQVTNFMTQSRNTLMEDKYNNFFFFLFYFIHILFLWAIENPLINMSDLIEAFEERWKLFKGRLMLHIHICE